MYSCMCVLYTWKENHVCLMYVFMYVCAWKCIRHEISRMPYVRMCARTYIITYMNGYILNVLIHIERTNTY
jgi:hypothetical protein